MTLLTMQRDFRDWLHAESPDAAVRIGESAAPGLRVYQNNYRAQLIACLEDAFPRTREWIGGAAFHAATVAYIERLPPSDWTLDTYPRDVPATLALIYPDDPEVFELAWLEHALADAFVARDAVAVDAALIATVDWDHAVLVFTPSLDIADAKTNAPAIWSALAAGIAPPSAMLLVQAGGLLVWRHKDVSCFRAVDSEEKWALLALRAGRPFAAICEELARSSGEAGVIRSGTMLGRWISDGLVCDVETSRAV